MLRRVKEKFAKRRIELVPAATQRNLHLLSSTYLATATMDQNTSTASRTSITSNSNPLLCHDHQRWDHIPAVNPVLLGIGGWDPMLHRHLAPLYPGFVPTTHTLEDLITNSQCLVCAATASAVTRHIQHHDPRYHTQPFIECMVNIEGLMFLDTPAENQSHQTDSSMETEYEHRIAAMLEVVFPKDPYSMWWTMEMRLCLRFITTPTAPGQGKLFRIEPCEIPFFTPSLLKSWIQTCDTVHGSNCGTMRSEETESMDYVSDFRVIDVVAMQVVRPIESVHVRFVSLSYMWPKGMDNSSCLRLETQNLGSLEAPGGLENLRLPLLISDAISLSRDLGERYLWVDRLCIVQDDAQSKHRQICAMDKIYSLATFTIIAALNDTEARGLPGFRGCPRQPWNCLPRRRLHYEFRLIDPSPNGTQAFVDNSLWNGRGWTFQERVMSRRRLFITEAEVIFECGRGEVEEVACRHMIYLRGPPVPFPESQRSWLPTFRVDREKALSTYFHWISDYTARRLTFEDDILNAFAGVGNMLSRLWHSSPMLFGLPESYLAQTLVWSCRGSTVHRKAEALCIPSWSWATSVNPVDYLWCGRCGLAESEQIVDLVCFHYQDPDIHQLRPLHVVEQGVNTVTDVQSQVKYDLHLNPIACDLAGEFPGALVFNTTIASLRVGRHKYPKPWKFDHDTVQASIDGPGGELVGWINAMHPYWTSRNRDEGTIWDFIVTGGSPLKPDTPKDVEDNDNSWRLNIMMVERVSPDNDYVVRRIDVGYAYVDQWEACKPIWDTVVLC